MLSLVWPLPRSLATTCGISFDFSSSPYLDVSVREVPHLTLCIYFRLHDSSSCGFPHSEICGSKLICSSPQLIAACHVLHRLLMPRHSPCALLRLNSFVYHLDILDSRLLRLNCCNHVFSVYIFASAKLFVLPNFTERPISSLSFEFLYTCSCTLILYSVFNEHLSQISDLRVRLDLSSRTVARQVLSALCSLTSVFGMGTGGPCTLRRRTIEFSFAHVIRVSIAQTWLPAGGLKWTRTTDLALIRRAL